MLKKTVETKLNEQLMVRTAIFEDFDETSVKPELLLTLRSGQHCV